MDKKGESLPYVSLSGYLWMKHVGGAWLSFRPRRKFFFVMDELTSQLLFYPDEATQSKGREATGNIPIGKVAVSLSEHPNAFIIHVDERKKIELECENKESCECWLQVLARRSKGERERCQSLPSESDRTETSVTRKYTLPPTIEGIDSGNVTLAMLEEKLKCLDYYHSHKMRTLSVPAAPVWLDDWVSNWLQQQPFLSRQNSQHNSQSNESPHNIESSTTSPCDSEECSTVSSENVIEDELLTLRSIVNRQKSEIERLTCECESLKREVMEYRLRDQTTSETERNRFLNAEVLRLNQRCREAEATLEETMKHLMTVNDEKDQLRREYASALQAAIRVPVTEDHSVDVLQVRLYGGDMHRRRVCLLIEEARRDNPSLPTLQSLTMGVYIDDYGFRVNLPDESLAIHYMACRLHDHYTDRLTSSSEHRQRWTTFMQNNTTMPLTKESRQLVRAGIPASMRSTVWKMLINQQVIAAKIQHGKYYYRNLCSLNGGEADRMFCSNHQKQINLDLLRTMPSNVHFLNASSKGVNQLQQVLRAFCLHNETTGYCQGMNFLAATSLLIVGPEDSFWLLVALTEGYLHESYLDESLSGAQADQEVLKELLEQKLPSLTKHLEECEIDLATITLNWFIALFFDAVPFKTLLRFWDCFLLEGPKVLFRFSIALLTLHMDEIMQKTDTIGVMKVVKAGVRLSFDVEGLFKLAFQDLNPFPSRNQLRSKQLSYLEILQGKLNQRAALRSIIRGDSTSESSITSSLYRSDSLHICDLSIGENGNGILIAGNKKTGKISSIELGDMRLTQLPLEWDCRAVSVCIAGQSSFVSFLSGFIVAIDISSSPHSILWELKLSDVANRLLHIDNTILACLANGSITVIEVHSFSSPQAPSSLELIHLPIGSSPITDAVFNNDHIWLALACKLVCLNRSSFSHVLSVFVACSGSCTGTPFFDRIVSLTSSPLGVFLATTNSTLLQLWDQSSCSLLFDISTDHDHRKPSLTDSEETHQMHISSLLYSDNHLWTGTSDGYIILYSVSRDNKLHGGSYSLHRYPAGTRLSAETSPGGIKGKQGQYYIPTREETLDGETSLQQKRFTVQIDRETNQYNVVRRNEMDMGEGPSRTQSAIRRCSSSRVARKESACSSRISRRRTIAKGLSIDSAVSVFSSDNTTALKNQPVLHIPSPIVNGHIPIPHHQPSTTSSNLSMDYDDLFELYSEYSHSNRLPTVSCPQPDSPSDRMCPSWLHGMTTARSDVSGEKMRLRRKDLEEDDTVVIAVRGDEGKRKKEEKGETETIHSTVALNLLMKVKISDSVVCKIVEVEMNGERMVVTCAGEYSEEEGVLRWRKEHNSDLWINDPVVDPCSIRRFTRIPSQATSPPSSS